MAVDAAGPLRIAFGLHVDQHRLAFVVRRRIEHVAAQRFAAFGDAHRPVAFGLPVADRRIGKIFLDFMRNPCDFRRGPYGFSRSQDRQRGRRRRWRQGNRDLLNWRRRRCDGLRRQRRGLVHCRRRRGHDGWSGRVARGRRNCWRCLCGCHLIAIVIFETVALAAGVIKAGDRHRSA